MRNLARAILALLCGLVCAMAAWFGLALLVIALANSGHDGGVEMSAFFQVGPMGGLVGFGVGVWLFLRFGLRRRAG